MSEKDIDVEKTIENIEKYGEANPKELQAEATPVEEKPFLSFKTNDDLLKYQLEYKAADRPVKEDLATILQRASKGYHYAQEMQKLKAEKDAFEAERSGFKPLVDESKALHDKWSKFEAYAKENPQWYDHWNRAWESRGQDQASDGQPHVDIEQKLQAVLSEKLKPYESLLTEKQQLEQKARMAEDDRVLDDQIKSIRSKYPNIDFDRTDPETGKSLEYKVFEFMTQNGMTNFGHAFKAFYHDNLVSLELERKQELEQKAQAERKKAGIVDVRDLKTPKRQIDTKLSWDQIAQMAQKDLGIE